MALNYSDKLERIYNTEDIKNTGSKVLSTNSSLTEPLVFDIYESIYSKIANSLQQAKSKYDIGEDAILTVGALEELMIDPEYHLTGIQGVQSAQGIQGIQGPRGKNNIIADAGVQGIQGLIGSTANHSKGDTGAQGLQGIQGLSPNPISVNTIPVFGDEPGVTTDDSGNRYKLTNKSISGGPTMLGSSKGIQGPVLCKGEVGLQGFPGENISWNIEIKNIQFNPFLTSAPPEMAVMNFDGGSYMSFWGDYVQGVQGPIGMIHTGETGFQGPQGDKGDTPNVLAFDLELRYKGPTGPQGPQGDQGPKGPNGRDGLDGNNISLLQTITDDNRSQIMDEIRNSFRNLGIIIDNQYIEFNT